MAYTNSQKRQHIMELQTYLYAISLMDNRIPGVVPDGTYGAETVNEVKAFQEIYGLPVTGNTDSATWRKIVSVYKGYLHAAPIGYHAFPSSAYTVHSGDHGQLVYILQAMLNDIGNNYDNSPCISVNGDYDTQTSEAVRLFQKRSGLPQNGDVDSGTWNMLVRCCEHINSTLLKNKG